MTVDSCREKQRQKVEIVHEVTGPEWEKEVARRGRSGVGKLAWSGLETEAATESCRFLASLAKRLDKMNFRTQQEIAEFLEGSASEFPQTRRVAVGLFSKIVVDHAGNVKQVALSLRIIGVFICASLGRPEKCPCWTALVKRAADIDSAKERLRNGLPEALAT